MGFTPKYSAAEPAAPLMMAKRRAPRVDINPRTKGRFRVRDIMASHLGSYSMLKAFADAAHSAVPVVRNRRVRVESEGASVDDGCRSSGTGYRE